MPALARVASGLIGARRRIGGAMQCAGRGEAAAHPPSARAWRARSVSCDIDARATHPRSRWWRRDGRASAGGGYDCGVAATRRCADAGRGGGPRERCPACAVAGTWAYPVVPILFLLASVALVMNSLWTDPVNTESSWPACRCTTRGGLSAGMRRQSANELRTSTARSAARTLCVSAPTDA